MNKTREQEEQYLELTISKLAKSLEFADMRDDANRRMYAGDPRMLQTLLYQNKRRKNLLERSKSNPYFARIDFNFAEDGHEEECYIGKVGIYDDKNAILTVDWRAPISRLYYDSNVGPTSFDGPKGVISGNLTLKRQYEIQNGLLVSFQDVDTVSNDEILKPYLGANIDNRLKNIVATIQAEQNKIIREPLSKNMIIQGSAGSGKTTVALHRVAYLVYNYQNIKPDQFLVIGPNKFFVKYISSVLPELDVDNVEQLTYAEIVKRILGIDFTLLGDDYKLSAAIRNPKELFYEKLRVSMLFKSALDKYLEEFERKVVPTKDFQIKGYTILPADVIKDIYDKIEDDGALTFDNLAKKIDRAYVLIGQYIANNSEEIMDGVRGRFFQVTKSMSKDESIKESKKREFAETELRNRCNVSLKDHFSASRPDILSLYSEFLKGIGKYIDCEECDITKSASTNATRIKKKELEFEDLASIIYLYYKVYGAGEFEKFRNTVIDEAQDLGPFNFYALKKLLVNSSFGMFGDLAQSIYPYRGVQSWDEVAERVFDGDCETKVLTKSYRTTIEIMTSANNLTRFMELPEAEPTIRHGDAVSYVETEKMPVVYMAELINSFKQKGYSSAAIICKDEEEANAINAKLKQIGIDVPNVTSSDADYNGGVCTITCQLAKGLEFDGVIISDASEHIYSSERIGDMKLLYVAMTRPLHELYVLHSSGIAKPLEADKKKLGNVARVKE